MHLRFADIEIGCTRDDPLYIADYSPSSTVVDASRTPNLGRDGMHAGVDFLREAVWDFSLTVSEADKAGVLSRAGALESAWKAAAVRSDGVTPLEYSNDHGITWFRVYGRPLRFTGPKADYMASRGHGAVEIQFEQTDPLHYASAQSSTSLSVSPEASGGLVAPITAPIRTGRTGGIRSRLAVNAGDKPTPVTLTFHGPVQDPWVALDGGWKFRLKGSLAGDEYLVVDGQQMTMNLHSTTSPSVRPAYRFAALAGSKLTDLVIPAGDQSLSFSGVDPTGRAGVDVAWHSAFTAMQYGGLPDG